jgi:hypothetical protein
LRRAAIESLATLLWPALRTHLIVRRLPRRPVDRQELERAAIHRGTTARIISRMPAQTASGIGVSETDHSTSG